MNSDRPIIPSTRSRAMSKRTKKTRRRASANSDVVVTTLPSGEREFVVDAKTAPELSPYIEHEVVEFKAAAIAYAIAEEDRAVLAAMREETKAQVGREGGLLSGRGRLTGASGQPIGCRKMTPAQEAANAQAAARTKRGVAA